MRNRPAGLALLLTFSLAAAACGRLIRAAGSSPVPGPSPSPSPTPSPSATATPVCSGSNLQVLAEYLPGLSHGALWVMGLKNVGPSACTVQGFPEIGVHGTNGRSIGISVTDDTTGLLGPGNPTTVVRLQPGQAAGFWLENHMGPNPNPPCPAIPATAALDVGPAGARGSASIGSFPLGFTCDQFVVSPFHAGYTFPPGTYNPTPGESPSPQLTSSP